MSVIKRGFIVVGAGAMGASIGQKLASVRRREATFVTGSNLAVTGGFIA